MFHKGKPAMKLYKCAFFVFLTLLLSCESAIVFCNKECESQTNSESCNVTGKLLTYGFLCRLCCVLLLNNFLKAKIFFIVLDKTPWSTDETVAPSPERVKVNWYLYETKQKKVAIALNATWSLSGKYTYLKCGNIFYLLYLLIAVQVL